MFIKSWGARLLARYQHHQNAQWMRRAESTQIKWLKTLIETGQNTQFGKDYNFDNIATYEDFKKSVPIVDYEGLKPYVDRVIKGESDVLWKGIPLYFAKTSGTTSGAKYIPISKESMPFHIKAARDMLLAYIHQSQNADFVNGKMIFLQGSPLMEKTNGIETGRLSGIAAHYVPKYLQSNRKPSWETNCIEDWTEKLQAIVQETIHSDMRLISGIPPWIQMYFEQLMAQNDQPTTEIFPKLQLLVTGGVNYEPYRAKMQSMLGKSLPVIQSYPASEGFIAYQDMPNNENLLLLLNHGIFYEFIPLDQIHESNPERLMIHQVKKFKDYAIVLNTNAGLWGYLIGDTVQFTSTDPYRIIVSGRIKHFISAFGEHVIAKEVESALQKTTTVHACEISEFSVGPQVNPAQGLPHHEWFIEFHEMPKDLNAMSQDLDAEMRIQNSYYDDLIAGKVLRPLQITPLKKGAFERYMEAQGKLGGQNKSPRLVNDRKLANWMYDNHQM